ncbi:MAG: HAD family phosphatase [Eubacteriales bacterium]|nr:HAD family phosphatase [Eubacteriales bacterium]
MLKAVIFDMDGVLFDTEPIGVNANIEAAKRQGFVMTYKESLSTLGQTAERSLKILKDLLPGLDIDKFNLDYAEYLDGATKCSVPLKPYAKEAITMAKDCNILCALCSSNSKDRIDRYLRLSGFTGLFDAIVSGDDGAKSKPAPDMYLLTAEKLGVLPEHCLVFEDSTAGLKAAYTAQMKTYMVPDLLPYSEEYAAFSHGFISSLKDAPQLYKLL